MSNLRKSSVELRKLTPHIIMNLDDAHTEKETFEDQMELEEISEEKECCPNLMQKTCLNPEYSLRKQIMLAFGTTITLTILCVMLASVIVTVVTTYNAKSDLRQPIVEATDTISKSSPRYISEILSLKLPTEPVSLIAEVVMDRFAGYPHHEGYEDDSAVPFFDIITQRKIYPLNSSSSLPLDWQIKPNVNESNYQEHVQNRWSWYGKEPIISTRSCAYAMQGACDPSTTLPSDPTYFENCTDANNDLDTGGAVTQSPTNKLIARKAADLNFLLKSIYEQYQDVRDIGVYFANAGAGSVLYFPHYRLNSNGPYKSIGCEWMSQPNPFDSSRPIASDEEIKRCRPEGEEVNSRAYNVLERDWCRQMALDPFRHHIIGPLYDAWGDTFWHIKIGKAVYDRITNEFIACVAISVSLESFTDKVTSIKIGDEKGGKRTKTTIVKWDEEGTVLASSNWHWSSAAEATTIANRNIGNEINKKMFEDVKSLVNFKEKWDPKEVRKAFEVYNQENGGMLVSAYPLPVPPEEYAEEYFPQFMVILSIDKEVLDESLNSMHSEASDTEIRLIIIIAVCGVAGLAVSFTCIYMATNYLTKPLIWISDISKQIVNQCGRHDDKDIDYTGFVAHRCAPKTELSALVEEFQKMISCFSGRGSAKVEDNQLTEVKNNFNLFAEFDSLYSSRRDPGYRFDYNSFSSGSVTKNGNGLALKEGAANQDDTTPSIRIPRRCYLGENIIQPKLVKNGGNSNSEEGPNRRKLVNSSPLFWWIMGLILTPLLITTITISGIVTWKLSEELPSLFTTMEELYINIEKNYISSAVMLRSDFTELVTKRGLREVQILNRVASWLLFGGIERSNSLTEMTTAAEKCKSFELGTCPFLQNKTEAPCDCEWNDVSSLTCYSYNGHSRYLQKLRYNLETHNTWPNGDRNSTSFPNVSFSPSTTTWLDNVEDAPGFKKGSPPEGYRTTYDRMGVISALSIIQIPLYNYNRRQDRSVATYAAFEADGMTIGYQGCGQSMGYDSSWKSTQENGASTFRPELCPIGKYGYDPRCREWYATGKKMWEEGLMSNSPLYVTSPYVFAVTHLTGQSCTLPLADPITKQHIGQTLVDFAPTSVFSALERENTQLFDRGFSFVITADGETVTGPGFTTITNEKKPPIEKLVIPHDDNTFDGNCANTDGFETILCDMKSGKNGTTDFTRLKNDASSETVYISFAPVNVKHFFPWDSSDFSRGVKEYESMLYSIALVVPESAHFQKSVNTLDRNVNIALGVLCALILIGTASVTIILSRVTASITKPVLHLLEEIKKVNRLEIHYSSLRFTSEIGSRDMQNICNTVKTLFLVVHLANSAYFSGELQVAHRVLADTLSAFKSLGNKKAIGVASNNLGNIMLAMYRTMLNTGDDMVCGMKKQQIISKGTVYFLQAIKLGEETYDEFYEEEGWSKNCLVFMKHLSNRYFNRAIFLLTVQEDHETPDLAKQMAFRDLEIVFNMDVEVVDQCIEMGIVQSKKEHFESIMGRVRGLLEILESSYYDEWNVKELLDNALKLLKSAMNNPANDLFLNLGPAGRMQQLDCQLINYIMETEDDLTESARIAIRMLVEDEYILSDAYMTAMGTLIEYAGSESGTKQLVDSAAVIRELFAMRTSACLRLKEHAHRVSSHVSAELKSLRSFTFEPAGDEKIPLPESLTECNRGDVTMETF